MRQTEFGYKIYLPSGMYRSNGELEEAVYSVELAAEHASVCLKSILTQLSGRKIVEAVAGAHSNEFKFKLDNEEVIRVTFSAKNMHYSSASNKEKEQWPFIFFQLIKNKVA